MIRVIDGEKISNERRYSCDEDDFGDIEADIMVKESIIEGLTPFIYDGYIYSPGFLSLRGGYCVCDKTPVDIEDVDYEYTDEIVCPYCGYKQSDSWESEDSSDEVICEFCNSKYAYQRNMEVTYSSVKIEKVKLKEIKKGDL